MLTRNADPLIVKVKNQVTGHIAEIAKLLDLVKIIRIHALVLSYLYYCKLRLIHLLPMEIVA